MGYQLAADLLVFVHFGFILFVICGVLLILRWSKLIWLHLPAVAWAVWIELSGWICPLTPLENHFRQLAGQEGYRGSFVAEYLLPVIYPAELTRELQLSIAGGVLLVNLLGYGFWFYQRRK